MQIQPYAVFVLNADSASVLASNLTSTPEGTSPYKGDVTVSSMLTLLQWLSQFCAEEVDLTKQC